MNGNFRVGWLVHLPIVHNMHQFFFAPTQALRGTNAQNIENQHFFSQFQQIRTFYQIQSFQNDFKLYRNQLLFVKLISGYMNFMFQRHVCGTGIISLWKYNILYAINCLIWVTGTSPIRLSLVGRWPLAKIQGYIGETPLHFRQLAKFRRTRWRKYDGLSPVVTDQY
jgi:hypothetical protein